MRKNSIKNTRINGEVQKELGRTCKAYISVLGDKEAQKATLAGLNSAMGYIRKELARSVNLRNTPAITFVMDQSIEYGVNMSRIISEVNKDLKEDLNEEE